RLGRVFAGVSRKSFLARACGEDVRPDERRGATVAAELLLAKGGVDCIRTHEPRMLRQALKLMDEVK
ncbi:MAG: dihydropteroate synthase, partial [Victivallaceae bacterium]|nr:dihydropteroate synthase [Victivallaceae bacterium]